jgi:uncharacterized membrane protein
VSPRTDLSARSRGIERFRQVLLVVMAAFYVLAGLNHFRDPDFYVRIMPPYVPWHRALVFLSGVAEVVLGALVLPRKTRRIAGLGLIALLAAVFPANVHMALHPDAHPDVPAWALYLRLPLQGVLVAWAYWVTRTGSDGNDST